MKAPGINAFDIKECKCKYIEFSQEDVQEFIIYISVINLVEQMMYLHFRVDRKHGTL